MVNDNAEVSDLMIEIESRIKVSDKMSIGEIATCMYGLQGMSLSGRRWKECVFDPFHQQLAAAAIAESASSIEYRDVVHVCQVLSFVCTPGCGLALTTTLQKMGCLDAFCRVLGSYQSLLRGRSPRPLAPTGLETAFAESVEAILTDPASELSQLAKHMGCSITLSTNEWLAGAFESCMVLRFRPAGRPYDTVVNIELGKGSSTFPQHEHRLHRTSRHWKLRADCLFQHGVHRVVSIDFLNDPTVQAMDDRGRRAYLTSGLKDTLINFVPHHREDNPA